MSQRFNFEQGKTTLQAILDRANKVTFSQLPLPWFMLFSVIIYLGMYLEVIPVNMIGGLAIILSLGWLLGWLGGVIPFINKIGGATILSMLVPSLLRYYQLLPVNSLEAVQSLMIEADFMNLYVYALVLGSILSINRLVLIKGLTRMMIPLAVGFCLALLIPTTIGALLGLGFRHSFFFIVAPVLSGGLAAGVLPLAAGLSEVSDQPYGELIAMLIPGSIIGNLVAVGAAACLKQLGKQRSHLSGNGQLIKTKQAMTVSEIPQPLETPLVHQLIGTGLFTLTAIVILGAIIQRIFPLPLAVIIIIVCLALKLGGILPPVIEASTSHFNGLLSSIFTYAILVSMGFVYLDLEHLLAVLTWQYLLVIATVILTLVCTGFFLAPRLNMYPVELGVISLNQAAMGGMGNITILATSDCEPLMPFAQVATRVNGVVTISLMVTLYQLFS